MTEARLPVVSEADRARMARQASALAPEENFDEGDAEWEAAVVDWANGERARSGVAPLRQWWETKTEPELHARARALGLVD